MSKSSEKLGVVTVLLERLEKQRLPRLLSLQKKVNRGEALSEPDLSFLQKVSADAMRVESLLDNEAQYQSTYVMLVGLYGDITRKALANEKDSL